MVTLVVIVLNEAGYRALPYHAGLSDDERKSAQDAFIQDRVQTIVATVAFVAYLNLEEDEISLYEMVYKLLVPTIPRPDLVIYLQAPADVLLHRIRQRGDLAQALGHGSDARIIEFKAIQQGGCEPGLAGLGHVPLVSGQQPCPAQGL